MVAPSAFVDPSCCLSDDATVWHFAVVLADVTVSRNTVIGSRVEVGRGSFIGQDSRIGSGTFLPANSTIGSRVFVGPNVTFTDDRHPVAGNSGYHAEPPVVENDVSIGAGAVILPGVHIGAGARIGAGAIVTRDVPPGALVRSEPARQRGEGGCPPELMAAAQKVGITKA